jgi:hypothetical protein
LKNCRGKFPARYVWTIEVAGQQIMRFICEKKMMKKTVHPVVRFRMPEISAPPSIGKDPGNELHGFEYPLTLHVTA